MVHQMVKELCGITNFLPFLAILEKSHINSQSKFLGVTYSCHNTTQLKFSFGKVCILN